MRGHQISQCHPNQKPSSVVIVHGIIIGGREGIDDRTLGFRRVRDMKVMVMMMMMVMVLATDLCQESRESEWNYKDTKNLMYPNAKGSSLHKNVKEIVS